MHHVVAGAGYLGRRVLNALPPASAIALGRTDPGMPGIRHVRFDADGDGAPLELPSPFGLLYTVPPPPHGKDDPRLQRLLDRLVIPPDRFVYISTTGVYGDRGGRTVTEDDPVKPGTDRARRRVAAEARVTGWCRERNIPCLVLRVPGIYGPGRLGKERLAEGGEVLRDDDAGPGNRIHVDDLAACCLAAMTGRAPAGIYNLGDGDHRPSGAFSRAVARLAGLPAPRTIGLAEAGERWSSMRLSFARESRRVDIRKMREVLGVEPAYDNFEDGIRASLAAERSD